MSLKALDALRELAADVNSTEIIDHLGVVGKFMFHVEWLESWHEAFDAACAEIEREVAERYMELPVDADGVPIHVGDVMEYIATDPFMVCAVAPGVIHAWAKTNPGERKTTEVYPTAQCRHVKPRTIEDVLRDCCNEWNEHLGNDWESGVYAKYAAELRELIGGGE